MGKEYYVVKTCYSWDRIATEEHVFRTRHAAEAFYKQKEKEFLNDHSMSVYPVEVRYFED